MANLRLFLEMFERQRSQKRRIACFIYKKSRHLNANSLVHSCQTAAKLSNE